MPPRPAPLAVATFYVFGSIAVRLFGRGIIHSAGAAVANRLDVVTVHFCHAHYRAVVRVPRRRRDNVLYRLNESALATLLELAEIATYRPNRAGSVVAVSTGLELELRTRYPSIAKITHVIPNAVDLDRFRPLPELRSITRQRLGLEESIVALFVGGDWERKGLRFALEALSDAQDWHLLVVGDGNEDHYKYVATRLGVLPRVRFMGVQRDTRPFYAAADCFVFPTAYEAFPLAALEAAASGLPLLAPAVSGVEEVLTAGVTGWFIDRSGPSIAARLREIGRQSPSQRKAMSEAARNAVRSFSWENLVTAYADLYLQIARSAGDG